MSRSWERMVQKNAQRINKQYKKEGKKAPLTGMKKVDRFQGRNYIFPFSLLVFIMTFVFFTKPWTSGFTENIGIYWSTVAGYVLIALFYFFRRPYLAVTHHMLETRKFTGYKTVTPEQIRKVQAKSNAISIELVTGRKWVFSQTQNRFPIHKMSVRLEKFCEMHNVPFES